MNKKSERRRKEYAEKIVDSSDYNRRNSNYGI
jgi:hypothetical protein